MPSGNAFPALTGFYKLLFLYIEPFSTAATALAIWIAPGAAWFHHELIPSLEAGSIGAPLDPRTKMAIWQLSNCYFLLGLLSSFVFRAVRNSLPRDPTAQERIIGATLFVLAVADLTHIAATILGLPDELRYSISAWNPTTHGNITAVVLLFLTRVAWFLGIGRTSYYYGHSPVIKLKAP